MSVNGVTDESPVRAAPCCGIVPSVNGSWAPVVNPLFGSLSQPRSAWA